MRALRRETGEGTPSHLGRDHPENDENPLFRGHSRGADDGIRTRDPHLGNPIRDLRRGKRTGDEENARELLRKARCYVN